MPFTDATGQLNRACLSAFGEAAVYTPQAPAEPFEVVVIPGAAYRDEYESSDVRLRRPCHVLQEDLAANGVMEPADQVRGGPADTVTLAGPGGPEVWTVTGKAISAGMWVLELSRDIRVR